MGGKTCLRLCSSFSKASSGRIRRKWFIDRSGQWVVKPSSAMLGLSEGLVAVEPAGNEVSSAGGQWVVKPVFGSVGSFSEPSKSNPAK